MKDMNWKEITDKYSWVTTMAASFKAVQEDKDDPRWLYDFFDSNDICVSIYGMWDEICFLGYDAEIVLMDFDIGNPKRYDVVGETYFVSRTEAEEAAFNKAFEILEDKLK